MFGKFLLIPKPQRGNKPISSTPKKEKDMFCPTPIDIDQEENDLLKSDTEENQSSVLDKTISNISSNLSNLEFNSGVVISESNFVHSSPITNAINNETDPLGQDNQSKELNNKRGRSNNSSMSDSNPTKKLRTLLDSLPSMAEALKTDMKGHVVDVTAVEGDPEITIDQNAHLQKMLNDALFSEEDISKLKFNEPPSFNGGRLRLICHNDETKDWVNEIIPKLDLWENANLKITVVGPPPKLIKATMVMPAPTFEPPILFTIIHAQNPTIDTKFWKYQSRTKVENTKQIWTIKIDENSIPPLKEQDFSVHVGMLGCIKISVNYPPSRRYAK